MCLIKTFSVALITVPDTNITRSYYVRVHEQRKMCLGRFVPACLNVRIPVYCGARFVIGRVFPCFLKELSSTCQRVKTRRITMKSTVRTQVFPCYVFPCGPTHLAGTKHETLRRQHAVNGMWI